MLYITFLIPTLTDVDKVLSSYLNGEIFDFCTRTGNGNVSGQGMAKVEFL